MKLTYLYLHMNEVRLSALLKAMVQNKNTELSTYSTFTVVNLSGGLSAQK